MGAHYEVANGVVTKYYYAEKQRIAMRTGGTLNYLLGDHLGSTSLTTDLAGNKISELRYKAWGEEPYASGSTATNYGYTGQYSYTDDFGLMYYGARWYDPTIGRFNQPDVNIPGTQGVQAWDRYAYVNNNPMLHTDPSGNWIETAFDLISLGMTLNDIRNEGMTGMNALMLVTDVVSVVLPIVPAGVSHALRAAKIASKLANTADAAADTVKIANKVDDVLDVAKKAPVIIGENMKRVKDYAKKTGGLTINDWIPENAWDLPKNKAWMKQIRDEGYTIIDIGPDFARRRKEMKLGQDFLREAYQFERKITNGYDKYEKAFNRYSKRFGGVLGFDIPWY